MKLEVARPLGLSIILVAAFLIVVPFINVLPTVIPIRLGSRDWRFGTWGFYLTALTMPTLGCGLLALGGVLRRSRPVLRVVFLVASIMALLAVLGLAGFLIDGAALRGANPDPGAKRLFNQGIGRTLVMAGLAIPALVAIAYASIKGAAGLEQETLAGKDSKIFVGGTF